MNYATDYSPDNLILVVNPRHPFTKIGVYNNNQLVFLKRIFHPETELNRFATYEEQAGYRKDALLRELKENDIDQEHIRVVITRGGLIKPVKSGIYAVNERVREDLRNSVQGSDIVNLGGLVAGSIADSLPRANAFIADPVVVDEYDDVARITGLPDIKRRSIFHALNQKHVARKYADSVNKKYADLNLVVAHLGTGITVGAHHKGRVIDANMGYDGDGPFSPIRAGGLPSGDLIRLCFSGKFSRDELLKKVSAEGGLYAHLGTFSGAEVDERVTAGDEEAARIFEAMGYQVAKTIGSMFAVLSGKVDAIIITGPMAHSSWLVHKITERIGSMGQVMLYPGSDDIDTLGMKGLAVMNGDEEVLNY